VYSFITVRTNSSRLPSKCLLKFGKINVLTHLIRRAKKFKITPIVCTTRKKSDDIIEKISRSEKINFFRGSEKNKIKRWYDCSKKFNIKYFHTIDADDPFFDPISVKKSINLCKKGSDIVKPSKISKSGGASEGWSFNNKAITAVYKYLLKYKKNIDNFDTEMIEPFLKQKSLKKITLKGQKYELKNARLTLDYKEDYQLLVKIVQNKGNFASRKAINNFFRKNKNLLKINFKKQAAWKKKQDNFKVPTMRKNNA
jgi:spore coat polysaccharide biosynthesis protein SpsF